MTLTPEEINELADILEANDGGQELRGRLRQAASELSALQKENAELKQSVDSKWRELLVHREMTKGNYWAWQGSNDNLESLVCPVGIHPEQLKSIIDERDSLRTQNRELREACKLSQIALKEYDLLVANGDFYFNCKCHKSGPAQQAINKALALQPEK